MEMRRKSKGTRVEKVIRFCFDKLDLTCSFHRVSRQTLSFGSLQPADLYLCSDSVFSLVKAFRYDTWYDIRAFQFQFRRTCDNKNGLEDLAKHIDELIKNGIIEIAKRYIDVQNDVYTTIFRVCTDEI